VDAGQIVLMTDHSSTEGSRAVLAVAVKILTGRPPLLVDARHFMTGGSGSLSHVHGKSQLRVPSLDLVVEPSAVIVYEIPPARRRRFETFQHQLRASGIPTLGADPGAWRTATEKNLTVQQFATDDIPQMETVCMQWANAQPAADAYERLGRNVWARPVIGMGGQDVFHISTRHQLQTAVRHYTARSTDWLMARDAGNFDNSRRRHQYRVVVLNGQVLRAVEHIQPDPDAPGNECRGAHSQLLALDDLPVGLGEQAISATKSVGLPFGGVDLAQENGGVVFEVNVHPQFGSVRGLETIAIPYVQAHLANT
jgi:glutathione synthase/RimK-type ligase-like ATP-grasp enzyme